MRCRFILILNVRRLIWQSCLTVGTPIDNEKFEATLEVLGKQAIVDLAIAINAINSWNRIAKTFKTEVGSYKPS